MDIEKMQKINALAKDLVQRGMATDFSDATRQAEMMINKDDSGISAVFNRQTNMQQQTQPSSSQSSSSGSFASNDNIDRLNDMRMELRKVAFQVSEQSKTIEELKTYMKGLNDEIKRMKVERPRPAIMEHEQGRPQTTLTRESTDKQPHAKVGNYTPENVSVEQFFYSGPK